MSHPHKPPWMVSTPLGWYDILIDYIEFVFILLFAHKQKVLLLFRFCQIAMLLYLGFCLSLYFFYLSPLIWELSDEHKRTTTLLLIIPADTYGFFACADRVVNCSDLAIVSAINILFWNSMELVSGLRSFVERLADDSRIKNWADLLCMLLEDCTYLSFLSGQYFLVSFPSFLYFDFYYYYHYFVHSRVKFLFIFKGVGCFFLAIWFNLFIKKL